jgi:hypothetical protein
MPLALHPTKNRKMRQNREFYQTQWGSGAQKLGIAAQMAVIGVITQERDDKHLSLPLLKIPMILQIEKAGVSGEAGRRGRIVVAREEVRVTHYNIHAGIDRVSRQQVDFVT